MHSKKQIKISYNVFEETSYITISNIGLCRRKLEKINSIIQYFVDGNELFFGFYRTDGLNLTKQEWQKYDKEIPNFFENNGEYKEIVEQVIDRKGKEKNYSGYLSVAKTDIKEELYEILPWIFQYYLETTLFCPKITFEDFKITYSDYMKHSIKDYVMKGYTDFLFSYFDSGDFSVCFNPEKYNPREVRKIINGIIYEGSIETLIETGDDSIS